MNAMIPSVLNERPLRQRWEPRSQLIPCNCSSNDLADELLMQCISESIEALLQVGNGLDFLVDELPYPEPSLPYTTEIQFVTTIFS